MPELPEIQLFCRNLNRRLAKREVVEAVVELVRMRHATPPQLVKALQGKKLVEVRREGKEIHFEFADGTVLGIHLMLHGRFDLTADPGSIKGRRLQLGFDGGEWLVLSDRFGWATVTLNPEPAKAPDALSPEFTLTYLTRQLQRRAKMPVKMFIVDQEIVRGIGNVFSDEILWAARIAPESPAGNLPEKAIKALHQSVQSVLKDAMKQTEQRAPEAINGKIRDFVKVHDARRKLSPTGRPIQHKIVGQKKSYYTDEQIVY